MIQIYAPGNTNFDRNGDVALQPSLCDLDMTINGEWELEIEAPADELGKFRAVMTGAVVAVPTPWSDKQLFRIYDHDTSDDGSVGLARPIFLDAQREVMILDRRPTSCDGQTALDAILSGTKYKGKSNIAKIATAYYIRKNAIQAIASDDENSFLNRWGGEIAYDNFTVTINERMGRDRGLRVEFGRNIKSIHDRGNSEDLATRIYPVAYNGRMISGDKQYVDSERIGDYPIVYSKILECKDIKLREDLTGEPAESDIVCDTQADLDAALRQRCVEQYAAGADVLETAYDVDMDDLSTKEEYAEYKNLEKAELGDTVHCRHRRLGISADARAVRMVWNCILRKNKKLYIGDFKKDYFARLNDTAKRLQELHEEMVESESRVNQAIKDASERLDKALKEAAGLYCTEKDDGKGGTIILLHDKMTLEESTNVIMLTADAIGFSTDGGKTYPYGFTIDGEFVARILSVYGINADWVNAGTLDLTLLRLAGTLCGIIREYGSTATGAQTEGIAIYGAGLDDDGHPKPPYFLITNKGIRGQLSDGYQFNASGSDFEMFGNIRARKAGDTFGNIYAEGDIAANGVLRYIGGLLAREAFWIGKDHTGSSVSVNAYTNGDNGVNIAGWSYLSDAAWVGDGGAGHGLVLHGNSITSDVSVRVTSDRSAKKDIEPLEGTRESTPLAMGDAGMEGPSFEGAAAQTPEEDLAAKYEAVLDNMTPVRFRYKTESDDTPYHLGYIAQDVEAAIASAGLAPVDMGTVAETVDEKGNKLLGIAYGELNALLHLKSNRQEKRLAEQEKKIAKLEALITKLTGQEVV